LGPVAAAFTGASAAGASARKYSTPDSGAIVQPVHTSAQAGRLAVRVTRAAPAKLLEAITAKKVPPEGWVIRTTRPGAKVC